MAKVDRTKWKSLVVSIDTYRWLKTLGQTSDSFNDVLVRLRQEQEEERGEIQTGVRGSATVTSRANTSSTPTPTPTFEVPHKTNTLLYK
jgi:hypothetical protein